MLTSVHKMAQKITATCRAPETIQYLLLECNSKGFPEILTSCCAGLELEPTLVNILSTPLLQDLVYDLISTTKRTL